MVQKGGPMQKAIMQSCTSVCCFLGFIIAVGVILDGSDKNCENPIREWLIVWIVVSSAGVVFMSIERILGASGKANKTVLMIFRIIVGVYGLFGIAWIIVGSVWLYTDDNCKDHFYDMWALTLAILIITYIGVGCCLFACCCALIMLCVKGKLIKKASKEEKSPDEVPAEAVRANDHAEVERKPSFERPADDDDDVPENAV